MTYRERRERKAERLREWADKREAKADIHSAAAADYIRDLPLGQPILVGHHSERRHRRDIERFNRNMQSSIEDREKADEMRQRADNIDTAADRAIYDDDPDAIERLEQKIAAAELTRAAVRRFNATCRSGSPDPSLLPDKVRADWEWSRSYGKQFLRPDGGFYGTGGQQIPEWKRRLARLKRERGIE